MRKVGRVIALVKSIGKFGGEGIGADSRPARRLQSHYSAPIQRISSQASRSPSTVYRPWVPTACISRFMHSSGVSRQQAQVTENATPVINQVENFLPSTTEGEKPRLVVLGTGWAGCRLMKDISPTLYDIICISPRNHMVFTPLLASTCVGTLEFRSVSEAVRTIQPALARDPTSYFYLARCTSIDTENRQIHCEAVGKQETADMKASGLFSIAYDKLVIALGAQSLTFGIPGVYEHAIFLREVKDAQAIRSKLLLNLAISDVPGVTEAEKEKILHCVVVGGGPTGVEFSGELSDFIQSDVIRKFSHVKKYIKVTLIEAKEILSSFDVRLRDYGTKQLEKEGKLTDDVVAFYAVMLQSGVKLAIGMVKEVHPEKLVLSDGSEVPYGLLVWSTGVGPSDFVNSLPFQKSPGGRIGVDERLRVPGYEDVYAIGDCSGYLESTGKSILPTLAQVAERQAKYLAKALNKIAEQGAGKAGSVGANTDVGKPFVYRHLGSMANVGNYKALVDLRENKASKGISMSGWVSWLIWRSAYLTRVISWRNRIYVMINWGTTFLFGRDISRF